MKKEGREKMEEEGMKTCGNAIYHHQSNANIVHNVWFVVNCSCTSHTIDFTYQPPKNGQSKQWLPN